MSNITSNAAPKVIPRRSDYAAFIPITSRWMDNDQYGHINNVVYYSYFDTAVNQWLLQQSFDVPSLGLVVQTHCEFHSGLSFPQTLHVGLRVGHMGRTSVRYELAVFAELADIASAHGHFVHVYVDAITRRPIELSAQLKTSLTNL
jgi:acyl-CoA thioester hydrolase